MAGGISGWRANVLDAVGLLTGLPETGLARGQVGTIVEELGDETVLVEFSDAEGRAYALAPCTRETLLVLLRARDGMIAARS